MSVTETSVVGPKGRVVVPQRFREQLGIDEGDELVFTLNSFGALTVLTRQQLVDSLAGSWATGSESLVDELFADRQVEAAADK